VNIISCQKAGSERMALNSMWCCALQSHVLCVTNREGDVVSVVCSERQPETRICCAKTRAFEDGLIGDLFRPGAAAERLASRCTLG
jgi:hypothetical protein